MIAIVPIIGYASIGENFLVRERIESLVQNMGYSVQWVDFGSIVSLHNANPASSRIPFIVIVRDNTNHLKHDDLLLPLYSKFTTCQTIIESIENLPRALYESANMLSLWEGQPPTLLVQQAVKYIYKNLASDRLTVNDICHNCCVSKDTLETKFHQWKRCSLWQFVIHLRMKEACRLLEETEDPIYNIGLSVGYQDIATFGRAFKKHISVTPKAFRQNIKFVGQKNNTILPFYLPENGSNKLSLYESN